MNTSIAPDTMRRSSRLPLAMPVRVTSLEPNIQFSANCETLVVNAHGCAIRSPINLAAGIPVHFHHPEGRETTAYVVDCQPMGIDSRSWLVGASLDEPDNFWGVKPCPADWTPSLQIVSDKGAQLASDSASNPRSRKPHVVHPKAQASLSEADVRALLAEVLQPLHLQILELREKLAQTTPRRSNFEVSLSQIPPELEHELWLRLREELGKEVLTHASHQTEQVLETARITIGKNISIAKQEFRQHLSEELQLVHVRAQRLSDEIDDGVRQQLEAGLEAFHAKARETGAGIEERGTEFLRSMQQRLNEESDRRQKEIHQVQAAIHAENSQVQAHLSGLGARIQALDESAHHLETGMNEQLSQLSHNIIEGARAQLQSHIDSLFSELQTQAAKEMSNQIDVACGRLKLIQKGTETSVSELLHAQASRTQQSFERSLEQQAGETVSRWRISLARDLNNVAKILGEEMKSDLEKQSEDK